LARQENSPQLPADPIRRSPSRTEKAESWKLLPFGQVHVLSSHLVRTFRPSTFLIGRPVPGRSRGRTGRGLGRPSPPHLKLRITAYDTGDPTTTVAIRFRPTLRDRTSDRSPNERAPRNLPSAISRSASELWPSLRVPQQRVHLTTRPATQARAHAWSSMCRPRLSRSALRRGLVSIVPRCLGHPQARPRVSGATASWSHAISLSLSGRIGRLALRSRWGTRPSRGGGRVPRVLWLIGAALAAGLGSHPRPCVLAASRHRTTDQKSTAQVRTAGSIAGLTDTELLEDLLLDLGGDIRLVCQELREFSLPWPTVSS